MRCFMLCFSTKKKISRKFISNSQQLEVQFEQENRCHCVACNTIAKLAMLLNLYTLILLYL